MINLANILMTLGTIGMGVSLFMLVEFKWALLWFSLAIFIGGCVAERVNHLQDK